GNSRKGDRLAAGRAFVGRSRGGMTDVWTRLKRDAVFTAILARTLRRIIPLAHKTTLVLPDVVEGLAARHGERPALVSETETLSYAGLDARANRYARWAMANGVGKGDTVCLLMPN